MHRYYQKTIFFQDKFLTLLFFSLSHVHSPTQPNDTSAVCDADKFALLSAFENYVSFDDLLFINLFEINEWIQSQFRQIVVYWIACSLNCA